MKGKKFISRLFIASLLSLFLQTPAFSADYFHILIYHRFGDQRYPSTSISLDTFAAQMGYLHDNGFHVLSITEAAKFLREGGELPEKSVLLTVDDGYQTFKSGAMPILKRFAFPVTLFVNTDSVGGAGYLTWDELRELSREGVEIGNHTASHGSLTDRRAGEGEEIYRQRLFADIDRAQKSLIREIGKVPQFFAYPYGEYSRLTEEIVKDYGFQAAFAQYSGVCGHSSPLFSLPRIPLTGRFATLRQMKEKLAFRPMPARIVAPGDTLVAKENPPVLVIDLLDSLISLKDLRFFVNGEPVGAIRTEKGNDRRLYLVASKGLPRGRSQYVLTTAGRDPGTFYGLSQFWLNR